MLKIKSNRIITSDGLLDGFVYVDGGKIVACGTHSELLKTSNIYREIYEAQTKKSAEETQGGVE